MGPMAPYVIRGGTSMQQMWCAGALDMRGRWLLWAGLPMAKEQDRCVI